MVLIKQSIIFLYGLFAKSASGATVFGLNGEMCPYY
jgi:hypothetical protein